MGGQNEASVSRFQRVRGAFLGLPARCFVGARRKKGETMGRDRGLSRAELVPGKVLRRGGEVVSGEVFQASVKAERILERARQRGEQILEEARKQKEKVFEQARLKGVEVGKGELTHLLTTAAANAERLREKAEDQMVGLAAQMAKKILEEELALHPERIRLVARKVLRRASWAQQVRVRANPDDVAELEEARADLMAVVAQVKELSVVGDPEVPRGGCVLETETGEVDARLDTQIEAMRKALEEELENE
mgnify:CR=1 FL=1